MALTDEFQAPDWFRPTSLLGILLAGLVGAAALAGGGATLTERATDLILRDRAEDLALQRAEDIVRHVPGIDALIRGEVPTSETVARLRTVSEVGGIFRLKFFAPDGRLTYVSDGPLPSNSESLAEHRLDSDLARSILDGTPHTEAKRGNRADRPPFYAEAYVPVRSASRELLGIIEVYVDQTETHDRLHNVLFGLGGTFFLLMLATAAGPVLLAFRRQKQMRAAEAKARFLSHHDALTGAASRKAIEEEMSHAVSRARRLNESVAALCVDVRRLSDINDRFGNAAGDELLRAVFQTITRVIRSEDKVGRLDGDRFIILQTGVPQPDSAEALAQRLVAALNRSYSLLIAAKVDVTVSIGIGLFPEDAANGDSLLRNAVLALNRAKLEANGTHCFFQPEMDARIRTRRRLEHDLKMALGLGELEVHYQPLVDAATGDVTGFEALARWTHRDLGPVSPVTFIPIAEESGLIAELGDFVVRRACLDATRFEPSQGVSVNLSPAQFGAGDLIDKIRGALQETGLSADRLQLEITEGVFIGDASPALETLEALKTLGVKLAMDDFGTGYSSLTYLWKYPFDKLKIDQAFVRSLENNAQVPAILRTIVGLAQTLGLKVTAEGVETEVQAQFLRALKCDRLQGYLFGKPQPLHRALSDARALGDASAGSGIGWRFDSPPEAETPDVEAAPRADRA